MNSALFLSFRQGDDVVHPDSRTTAAQGSVPSSSSMHNNNNYYLSSHTIHASQEVLAKSSEEHQTTGFSGGPITKETKLIPIKAIPTAMLQHSISSQPPQIYYNYNNLCVPNSKATLPFAMRTLPQPIVTPAVSQELPSSSQKYTYLVANLQRDDIHSSWGLTISLFSGKYLLISEFNNNGSSFPAYLSDLTVDPSKYWQKKTNHLHHTFTHESDSIIQRVVTEPYRMSPLAVGDCILEIAGKKVSEFQNLGEITQFLKFYPGTCLQLLLYRVHPNLRSHPNTSSSSASSPDQLMTAQDAYQRILQQHNISSLVTPKALFSSLQTKQPQNQKFVKQPHVVANPQNTLFRNAMTGQLGIYYDDDSDVQRRLYGMDPDSLSYETIFLPPITDFSTWLQKRKTTWRQSYRVYEITESWIEEQEEEQIHSTRCKHDGENSKDSNQRESCNVAIDFWSSQGYDNFHAWLRARKTAWKHDKYSWHRRKRQRLEQDREEIVHLDQDQFPTWLRVRKNQWRISRRKRQRDLLRKQQKEQQLVQQNPPHGDRPTYNSDDNGSPRSVVVTGNEMIHSEKLPQPLEDILVIDEILEEQERERELREKKKPLDLYALLEINQGCPDDVVSHVFGFLHPLEHGKMLALDRNTRKALMQRERLWQLLCPVHWKLPRRPRKPWHELYRLHLRIETEQKRKLWDDLLSRASNVLEKGDQLQSIEKLITEAEREYGFDVNYTSGVVCERNSILNLAVIQQRHKIVRYLVETKHADIESHDRGGFTPLLNAAWAGDKFLVRFLMQRGADRSKIGTCHYTKPLAHPDFAGLSAEGWAEARGHHSIAKLLRFGL